MRSGVVAMVMVAIAACNPVFGLDRTKAIEADANRDRDGDGIPNEDDLCPEVANATQHDEDGDGVGDACDPCPLDAATIGDRDADGIHDACDPGPQPHCLALFDSFETFAAADWSTVPGTNLTPGMDDIRVAGSPRGGLSPKGISGKHSLRFRAKVVAVAANGYFGVMGSTSVGNTDAGLQCRITEPELVLVNVAFGQPPVESLSPPLAASESIVVAMTRGGQPEAFGCRLERASGDLELSAPIQQGGAGSSVAITAVGSTSVVVLDNLAVYAEQTTPCEAPIVR